MSFVPLHLHTQYSLFEGVIKIPQLAKKIQSLQMPACAITDHNNLYGAIQFYRALKNVGVKPIIGQGFLLQTKILGLTKINLLCINRQGYQNLIKLSSLSYIEGKIEQQPTICWQWLQKYSKGLFLINGELASDLAKAFALDKFSLVKELVQNYKELFERRFYLEIAHIGLRQQTKLNTYLISLSKENDIPLVATNPCFYLSQQDAFPQLVLKFMGEQKKIDGQNNKVETEQLYLKTTEEMLAAFCDVPDAVSNTLKIAEICELALENKQIYLPAIATGGQGIRHKAQVGLKQRLQRLQITLKWTQQEITSQTKIYQDRLDYELNIIIDMGYEGYFLIVADFVIWAKTQGILVGPGRGSAAGSLVAYSLQITNVDPLSYGLLFERFLNPGRKSMPDIDIDFEAENRDKVIEYIKQKYGSEKVCQISAVGSLQAKAVIRGVARVLGMAYSEADTICRMIPNQLGITLKQAMEQNSEFADLLHSTQEQEKQLMQIALSLEGLNSNLSTHAAGIIIMDTDIVERIPLCTPKENNEIQTQYAMGDAEHQGAAKFDILGLKNLTLIRDCVNEIKKMDLNFDLEQIPIDNIRVYHTMSVGLTKGIFQMESAGMTRLIRRMKPSNFEDIIALIALYRPGPLESGMVYDYVDRKNLVTKVEYIHPSTTEILSSTYGVMVYQEQIIRIVQEVAGFSLAEADIFRRAIGKKEQSVMKSQESQFVTRCEARGLTQEAATKIFDNIEKFGGYGFNKSHSAAYAVISYQTAYLKSHYTKEFYCSLLNNELNNQVQIKSIIEELKKTKIRILLPGINNSQEKFVLEGNHIRFGFLAIKGIGKDSLVSLIKNRGTSFTNFTAFCKALTSEVNARVLKALISSGALDSLAKNRKQIFENLALLENISSYNNINESKQDSLFGVAEVKSLEEIDLQESNYWSFSELLANEKETLGFYLRWNPLYLYKQEIQKFTFLTKIKNLRIKNLKNNIWFACYIENIRIRFSKENKKKAEVFLEDSTGQESFYLSVKKYKIWQSFLDTNQVVLCSCRKHTNDNYGDFYIHRMLSFAKIRKNYTKEIILSFHREFLPSKQHDFVDFWDKIKNILAKHVGETSVSIVFNLADQTQQRLPLAQNTAATPELVDDLSVFLPVENIHFIYKQKITPWLLAKEANQDFKKSKEF